MRIEWRRHWLEHAHLISSMSPCPRGKVGAFIIDANNNIISSGFNGPPRKAPGALCGITQCNRDGVTSGTHIEIGCHHAEQNAICNAAKAGIALDDTTMIITTNPCLACARLIHHVGIKAVVVDANSLYAVDGLEYLRLNSIDILLT